MRRATLQIAGPPSFTVVIAQTTAERTQLLRRLLVYSGLAQLWLLVVLGSWLLRGIERDLHPLEALQEAMDQRDAADLQPLPPALTQQASTSDVQRLGVIYAEHLNKLSADKNRLERIARDRGRQATALQEAVARLSASAMAMT